MLYFLVVAVPHIVCFFICQLSLMAGKFSNEWPCLILSCLTFLELAQLNLLPLPTFAGMLHVPVKAVDPVYLVPILQPRPYHIIAAVPLIYSPPLNHVTDTVYFTFQLFN